MIIFKVVRWKNFLSAGNHFIEIPLNKTSTTLLFGKSGSGKSQLADALSFVLFGRPYRDINKNQLVNGTNQKACEVEVEFSCSGKEYKIKRGMKPNIFSIYQDDVLLNKDSHTRDYQEYLEKYILKFDYISFCKVIVLCASTFVSFMKMKSSDRRSIVENLLGIEVFSVMNDLLKVRIFNDKAELIKIDQDYFNINSEIDLHNKYLKSLSEDKDSQINLIRDTISKNLEKIKSNNESITKILDNINSFGDVGSEIAKIDNSIKNYNEAKIKIESGERKYTKETNFYNSNESCPVCLQNISNEFKENKLNILDKKLTDIKSAKINLNKKFVRLAEEEKKFKKMQDKINTLKLDIGSLNSENKFLINSNLNLDDQIRKLESSIELGQITKDINSLQNKLKELIDNKNNLINIRSIQDIAQDMLKDSGIKTKIIRQYLSHINSYMNNFLIAMNFFITFTLDHEFNECIKSSGHKDLTYGSFSDGERQRIDLALLFTWRMISKLKNSVNTNLLILDEIFDSYLDQESAENVLGVLSGEQFKDMNIFVISHKDTLTDKFSNIIKFKKNKNFSEIIT